MKGRCKKLYPEFKWNEDERESFLSFFSGLDMEDERNSAELYCKKYNVTIDVIDEELKS